MPAERHDGSCQCGAVRFSAEVDLDQTVTCNCSRCRRMGFVLSATPRASFALHAGEDALAEYRFATETISHRFCRTCGVEPFAMGAMPDGTEIVMVNVNCLDGVDPRALASQHFDGASR